MEVFSDYFEPTNVLYIDRGSHNSDNFVKKLMTLILVNLCPPATVCSLMTMY